MPFSIVTGDITRVGAGADAVVNAANSSLAAGGGVCGAIFAAAGHADLQAACDRIGHCDTGDAAVTPGFALCRRIVHAVGPVWRGGRGGEDYTLRRCWRSALEKARDAGAKTVFAPLISAGIYGYPPDQALAVAVSEIGAFLTENDLDVTLVIYDRAAFRLPAPLRGALAAHLADMSAAKALPVSGRPAPEWSANYAMAAPVTSEKPRKRASAGRLFRRREKADAMPLSAPQEAAEEAREDAFAPKEAVEEAPESILAPNEAAEEAPESILAPNEAGILYDAAAPVSGSYGGTAALDALLREPGESFSQMLLRLIDESGRTDADVYRRANLDRRLFSKIRSKADYQPSKATVLALAVSLRLDEDRTRDLLRAAGYALSPASRRDRIVEYFLRSGNYNIFELNEALFAYDEPALGA